MRHVKGIIGVLVIVLSTVIGIAAGYGFGDMLISSATLLRPEDTFTYRAVYPVFAGLLLFFASAILAEPLFREARDK